MPHLPRKVARRPGDKSRPKAPPSTISATPATQNDGRCEIVPRLPRETKVDVRLCHACHAKWRGAQATNPGPRVPPSTISGTPATRNDGRCEIVPRLPRETKVDVRLCHACHAKWRGAPATNPGPRAPPSTISGTPATQNDGRCEFVPRLPRDIKVDVRLCHACHAKTVDVRLCHACHVKRRWMSGCATPATQSGAAPRRQIPAQGRHPVP